MAVWDVGEQTKDRATFASIANATYYVFIWDSRSADGGAKQRDTLRLPARAIRSATSALRVMKTRFRGHYLVRKKGSSEFSGYCFSRIPYIVRKCILSHPWKKKLPWDGTLTRCKGAVHIRKSTTVIFWINCQFETMTLFKTKFQVENSVLPLHQRHPPLFSTTKVNFKFYLPRGVTVQNYSHPVFSVIPWKLKIKWSFEFRKIVKLCNIHSVSQK